MELAESVRRAREVIADAQQPVARQPVATQPTTPNTTAGEPCGCLTRQYLDDGSVLFRDLCTREAAIATQAELRAQALVAR